jgi:hypothetical protein
MGQVWAQTIEKKLYALWILLKVAVDRQVKRLQVFGDSKLLMDWENGKSNISNLELGPILDRIMEKKYFLKRCPLLISTKNSTTKLISYQRKHSFWRKVVCLSMRLRTILLQI